jgi:hypothetical protein
MPNTKASNAPIGAAAGFSSDRNALYENPICGFPSELQEAPISVFWQARAPLRGSLLDRTAGIASAIPLTVGA